MQWLLTWRCPSLTPLIARQWTTTYGVSSKRIWIHICQAIPSLILSPSSPKSFLCLIRHLFHIQAKHGIGVGYLAMNLWYRHFIFPLLFSLSTSRASSLKRKWMLIGFGDVHWISSSFMAVLLQYRSITANRIVFLPPIYHQIIENIPRLSPFLGDALLLKKWFMYVNGKIEVQKGGILKNLFPENAERYSTNNKEVGNISFDL